MPAKESVHFLVIVLLIFLGLVGLLFVGFLGPVVFGTLLAALSYKLYRRIKHALRDRENIAALATVAIVILIILIPATGILTILTREAIGLISASREISFEQSILSAFGGIADRLEFDLGAFLDSQLAPAVERVSLAISREIGGFLSDAVGMLVSFFVMAITAFYMLKDGKRFGEFLMKLSPLKTVDELTIYRTFRDTGLAVFYGQFAAAIAQGLLGGFGFFAFGLSSPVLWGTLMAFLSLIPLLGPYVITFPAAIYLFLSGKIGISIAFLIYNLLIVSTVDNLIRPEVVSARVNIHPLLVFLAILGGLKVFGLIGIIYGPLIVAIFLALLQVYIAHTNGDRPHSASA
ncbi:MAG: AI-2E family transporter [Patescibacteria group bacterium]